MQKTVKTKNVLLAAATFAFVYCFLIALVTNQPSLTSFSLLISNGNSKCVCETDQKLRIQQKKDQKDNFEMTGSQERDENQNNLKEFHLNNLEKRKILDDLYEDSVGIRREIVTNFTESKEFKLYGHHMFVIPEKKVMFCMFPKTGTTSFLKFIYEGIFKQPFPPRNKSQPEHIQRENFVHNTNSKAWKGKIIRLSEMNSEEINEVLVAPKYYRFSIKRDPILRLISGWKSKIQCSDDADLMDRRNIVHKLLSLAKLHDISYSVMSRKRNKKTTNCLNFDDYVDALEAVGKAGVHNEVDVHILNQNCMESIIDYDEKFTTETINQNTFINVKKILGFSKDTNIGHSHQTKVEDFSVTLEQLKILSWFVKLN